MQPISEINRVHIVSLGQSYDAVARYLRSSLGRRSYQKYLGSVYDLLDDQKCLAFQSECLIPKDNQSRPLLLCLFSNAHPESIRRGMFHFAESGVAALWNDLRAVGLLVVDRKTLLSPSLLRDRCLAANYNGHFSLALACYWIFPTFQPDHLFDLFGSGLEPPGFESPTERLNLLIQKSRPSAIICFNGEVFEELTGLRTAGYTRRIETELFWANYNLVTSWSCPIFLTYPAAWRYNKQAECFRQQSLGRIADAILERQRL